MAESSSFTSSNVARRTIGTVEIEGSNAAANAWCSKCDNGITPLGPGSWENAKHWAMRHVCEESDV